MAGTFIIASVYRRGSRETVRINRASPRSVYRKRFIIIPPRRVFTRTDSIRWLFLAYVPVARVTKGRADPPYVPRHIGRRTRRDVYGRKYFGSFCRRQNNNKTFSFPFFAFPFRAAVRPAGRCIGPTAAPTESTECIAGNSVRSVVVFRV